MLHYSSKDFFSPVIISPQVTTSKDLNVYVVSDLLYDLKDLTAEIEVRNWNNETLKNLRIKNIQVPANEATLIHSTWLEGFLQHAGCGDLPGALANCLVSLTLKNDDGEVIAPVNFVYAALLKNVQLPNNNIAFEVKLASDPRVDNPEFDVILKTDNIALFVWLEIGSISGRFSENGFHMLEDTKRVKFFSFERVAVNDIAKYLLVTSLSQIYNLSNHEKTLKVIESQLSHFGLEQD